MRPTPGWIRRRLTAFRQHASRGATLVEYALVTSLVLVGMLAVLDRLQAGSENEINNQATCVSDRPPPSGDIACEFAPVPTNVTYPDPNIVPPTTAPVVEFSDIYTVSAGPASEDMSAGWTLVLPVTVMREIQEPPTLPEGAFDIVVRARITMAGTPEQGFAECVTELDGTCELRYLVPYDDVTNATMLIIGVDSDPPPETLPPLYNFVRP